jgi:hypothetical protein
MSVKWKRQNWTKDTRDPNTSINRIESKKQQILAQLQMDIIQRNNRH